MKQLNNRFLGSLCYATLLLMSANALMSSEDFDAYFNNTPSLNNPTQLSDYAHGAFGQNFEYKQFNNLYTAYKNKLTYVISLLGGAGEIISDEEATSSRQALLQKLYNKQAELDAFFLQTLHQTLENEAVNALLQCYQVTRYLHPSFLQQDLSASQKRISHELSKIQLLLFTKSLMQSFQKLNIALKVDYSFALRSTKTIEEDFNNISTYETQKKVLALLCNNLKLLTDLLNKGAIDPAFHNAYFNALHTITRDILPNNLLSLYLVEKDLEDLLVGGGSINDPIQLRMWTIKAPLYFDTLAQTSFKKLYNALENFLNPNTLYRNFCELIEIVNDNLKRIEDHFGIKNPNELLVRYTTMYKLSQLTLSNREKAELFDQILMLLFAFNQADLGINLINLINKVSRTEADYTKIISLIQKLFEEGKNYTEMYQAILQLSTE
ncbi:MAG: hypothetical protein WBQ73_02570 [Candidatus Babeliales bacterium]